MIFCDSYCSHGGRCLDSPGHREGHHNSDCTWTDNEALTREQADEVLAQMDGGHAFLQEQQPIIDMIEAMFGNFDFTEGGPNG